jgi:hypothetical protein
LPLKLGPFSQQVRAMATETAANAPSRGRYLEQAQRYLRHIDADELRQKLNQQRGGQARMPWLVAIPYGPLAATCPAIPPPDSWCVVGCDSSSIPPDRHSSVRYYALNVGYAVLLYGHQPAAILDAQSQLCYRDADTFLFPQRREVPIEGTLLNARMEIASLGALRELAPGLPRPALALRDGPLVLWTLQNESEQVQRAVLREFMDSVATLRQERIALAGYISFSDGRDVTNSLRAHICPTQPEDCEACRCADHDLCIALASIRDRDLFGILKAGERSQVFASTSQILEQYGEHRIDFFYVNVGGEIARVEIPQWLSTDGEALSFVHAALYDQCQRSPGFPAYPPALLEAHEQAVITAAERQLVDDMIEQSLGGVGQRVSRSAKDDSKRRRGV